MAFLALLFFTLSCTSVLVTSDKWDCADYYWRDWRGGKVPYDAIPVDYRFKDRYMGSVYITGKELLPAMIYANEGYAETTAYNDVLKATDYIKILCGPYRSAFQWVHIHNNDVDQFIRNNLVIPAGSEIGLTEYFARTYINGVPVVGKAGAAFPNGQSILKTLEYDILTYNCSKTYWAL